MSIINFEGDIISANAAASSTTTFDDAFSGNRELPELAVVKSTLETDATTEAADEVATEEATTEEDANEEAIAAFKLDDCATELVDDAATSLRGGSVDAIEEVLLFEERCSTITDEACTDSPATEEFATELTPATKGAVSV